MSEYGARAVDFFAAGYNCCQAVLMSLCGPAGLDEDVAARLGTGFGLGMARGGTCGAVSGAVLALGYFGGGGGREASAAKTATYARARSFYDGFLELHGSLICRDLIGLDVATPQGLAQANREKRFQTICVPLVRNAAALAQAIALREGLLAG